MMRFSKTQIAILAIIVTNIIWGASSPIFKWSLTDIGPFSFAFLRFFIASILLFPFTIHNLQINKKELITLFVLSFIGFFVHISLFLFGLTVSSSINAPIIASSAPIFLIVGSIVMLKENIRQKILLGTIISLVGVMIIILRPLLDKGLDGTIIGNVLFVMATLSFVIYTLLLKEYRLHISTTKMTFYLFAIATVLFFPFFLWESSQQSIFNELTSKSLLGILFGSIFTSVIAYLLYNFALKYIQANETGIFLYIDPIIAILIAVPLLGEHITLSYLLGSLLVFVGLFIAENRMHYHPFWKLQKKSVLSNPPS